MLTNIKNDIYGKLFYTKVNFRKTSLTTLLFHKQFDNFLSGSMTSEINIAQNYVQFESRFITTDITALKLLEKHLIAGIGGFIHIFDTQSYKQVAKEQFFQGQKVHCFSIDPQKKCIAAAGGINVVVYEWDNKLCAMKRKSSWNMEDWVQYVQWIEEGLVILTYHNDISLWNWTTGERCHSVACSDMAILYSSLLIGEKWNELITFAGQVTSEVLVWAPSDASQPILHRLKGHKGVIFSISYNPELKRIHTTSDDRTVRIWQVEAQTCDIVGWREANITLLYTLFGHRGRVWCNGIIQDKVCSVGEDSAMWIWAADGTLERSWNIHHGASIWSIETDCKNLIFTGGGDGAICEWPVYEGEPKSMTLELNDDFARRVSANSHGEILAVTDGGCLLHRIISGDKHSWQILYKNKRIAKYCLLETSPCKRYTALASIDGFIIMFRDSAHRGEKPSLLLETKIVDGRIFSVVWLSSEVLLTSGPTGILDMWKISEAELHKVAQFELPASKERWISTAVIKDKFLICGDRMGSIHMYITPNGSTHNPQVPVQSFLRIHGHLGVTSLVWYGERLYSTGRDGTLRQFSINQQQLEHLGAIKLPMQWPTTTQQSKYGLLVIGFSEANLILWSYSEQRILFIITCGGGHRSWHFTLTEHEYSFVCIRKKKIYCVYGNTELMVRPILQPGFHAREIMSMKMVTSHNLVVSASEDTTLRISAVSTTGLHTLSVLRSHISSVRAVTVCAISSDYAYIFSGGGRAQLKAWKLNATDPEDIMCQELDTHMLMPPSKWKKPWIEMEPINDPEVRYMDLCATPLRNNAVTLFAGSSEGILRIFVFNTAEQKLTLVAEHSHHEFCILKVSYIETKCGKQVICSMGTDGYLVLWDFVSHKLATPYSSFSLHQSGINSFDWFNLSENIYLFATGGDDNALVLSAVDLSTEGELVAQWRNDFAHTAQITGVKLLENVLFSASVDECVALWKWQYRDSTLKAECVNRFSSSISDIQGLLTWHSGGDINICVHGKGAEIISATYKDLEKQA